MTVHAASMPTNERWTTDRLLEERRLVFKEQLDREPYDLEEALTYARRNAERAGTVSTALDEAKRTGVPCVVPRAGVASWAGQRSLMQALDDAGAGFLPITVDSLTRELHFAEAERRLAESTEMKSMLNGYPVVAHGVERNRELIEQFRRPVIIRANAVDLRIAAETGFASGGTAFVSGPMYATLEYSKNVTLDDSIPKWQYIFRLMGEYTEAGVPLADDAVGFAQSGTCSVPSLMHVGVVLDALIMAAQGVKRVMVYSMLQGNLAQDVASCRAVEILTREYLDRFGFEDVVTYVASSDWNGAFPTRHSEAYGLIAANVIAAAIAKAPLNYVKTIDEGRGVPTSESNADSIRITRYLFQLISAQADQLWSPAMDEELELNLLEARGILDAVLDCGDGDPVQGAIKGLRSGVLDIPFSPNVHVRGDVLPVRDANGAVRYLDHGNLAVPQAALRLGAERLAARSKELGYQDVVADLDFLELADRIEVDYA